MILIIFPGGVLLDYLNNIWLSLIVELVAYFPVIGIKIHFFKSPMQGSEANKTQEVTECRVTRTTLETLGSETNKI